MNNMTKIVATVAATSCAVLLAGCSTDQGVGAVVTTVIPAGVTEVEICELGVRLLREVWGERRSIERKPVLGMNPDRILGSGGMGLSCQIDRGSNLYGYLRVNRADPAEAVDKGEREVVVGGNRVEVSSSNLIRPHFEAVFGGWHAEMDVSLANSTETFQSLTEAQASAGSEVLMTVLQRAASS